MSFSFSCHFLRLLHPILSELDAMKNKFTTIAEVELDETSNQEILNAAAVVQLCRRRFLPYFLRREKNMSELPAYRKWKGRLCFFKHAP